MDLGLDGRRAIFTGGMRGIGRRNCVARQARTGAADVSPGTRTHF
ncbi:MAG: hypothetical protein ACR2OV_01225 [Hyphomicrobiaceae bacterium]